MIELRIKIDKIDYENVYKRFMPLLENKLEKYEGDNPAAKVGVELVKSKTLSSAALGILPQSAKDKILAGLVKKHRKAIISALNRFAKKNGIRVTVKDVDAR